MAIYQATAIARRIKRSVGEQTFCQVNGQNVVKMKIEENTSNTPAQQRQRRIFTELSDWGNIFGEAAALGFPTRQRQLSVQNAFMQANAEVVSVSEEGEITVDYTQIACSKGRLDVPKVTVTCTGEPPVLTFTHPAQKNGRCRKATDRLYAAVLEKELEEVEVFELNKRSEAEAVTAELDEAWKKENLCVYVFVLSENGDKASDTKYVEVS